jgi:phage pi2 protein 07
MSKQDGIHIYIFCCAEYRLVISKCIESIKKFVQHEILSINIVSNTIINEDGCNLIKDRDFWKIIDPKFEYKKIYSHNWIKQQLFKLNLDKIVDGNIVVFEADRMLIKPVIFFNNNKINFYTGSDKILNDRIKPVLKNWFDVDMLKINNQEVSFIEAECMAMTSFTIKKMRQFIEEKFSMSFLDIIDNQIVDSSDKTLSDYDLYGNYIVNYFPKLVDKIYVDEEISFRNFTNNLTSNSNADTAFLTFYEQVRGIDWPDCLLESNFYDLPKSIQEECITVFGYNPKNKT